MKSRPQYFAAALLIAAGSAFSLASAAEPEKLSFNRDIRPILSDKCFYCHGPDKNTREGKLRLDVREAAIEKHAIAPNDIEASELYWRITSTDEDELMPPPDSKKTLTDPEKKLLTRWIKEGAEYEEHWAWLSVVRPEISAEGPAAIDHFVEQRLTTEKLTLSPEAEPVTLARRLSFDLIGLPPTAEDLAFFQKEGIEKYVDRLLASPHFGERMAIDWLDAVRYADSVGYHGDQLRQASPFRDWVINAFNQNMPFDQFTIEQIAGDLLPNATLDQQIAASYNRLNQVSAEGGIQNDEYLAKYQSERVRTTSTAWLGTTLACAECHDHKFDPFLTKDFYQFAAYFADILEKGAYTGDGAYQEDTKQYERPGIRMEKFGPQLEVPSQEQRNRLTAIETELAERRAIIATTTPELKSGATQWAAEQREKLTGDGPIDYVYLEDKGELNTVGTKGWTFITQKDGPVFAGDFARKQESTGLVQHLADGKKKPLTLSKGDTLFAHVWLDPKNPPKAIMLQFNDGKDWSHRAVWGDDSISYGRGETSTRYFRKGPLPKTNEWIRLEVSPTDIGLAPGQKITSLAFTQFGGLAYWDQSGLNTTNKTYRTGGLSKELLTSVKKADTERDATDQKRLLDHYRTIAPQLAPQRRRVANLTALQAQLRKEIPTTPATISAQPREIRVLPRGNWMDKTGELVQPGPPHFLPGVAAAGTESDAKESGTRLDLAKWMVARENPLTSRTFVNRLWSRYFGNGLSNVLNDLGSQGEWPTHPQLLDWLAADFMESGWDIKQLVRTIALSKTYRQTSQSTPELEERDPDNRLFARQSRIRLPAELIRDNALAVSGLLNREIGGRSAHPYQPAGYYQHLNFPRREYEADQDANQYRRGVYTHWQRTFLHPAMMAFDAPPREECTMDRPLSNTPLQALVLLNDPSYVEAAEALAKSAPTIEATFQQALNREPTSEEKAILEDLQKSQGPVAVARAVLNLHESITRY